MSNAEQKARYAKELEKELAEQPKMEVELAVRKIELEETKSHFKVCLKLYTDTRLRIEADKSLSEEEKAESCCMLTNTMLHSMLISVDAATTRVKEYETLREYSENKVMFLLEQLA